MGLSSSCGNSSLFDTISKKKYSVSVIVWFLQKAISMSIRDQGLQHWPNQMEKVKQLHSQLLVRHGVMLVGPTGGGKSTTRNILQRALVLLPAIVAAEEAHHSIDHSQRRTSQFMVRGANIENNSSVERYI